MSLCASCQAPIFWVRTPKGKSMPLDFTPDPDGNVVIRDRLAHVLKAGELLVQGERRFTSHFATCANAAQHRKPKQ